MEPNKYPVSKKRLLLSWYIDFLFFMTLWGLLSYVFKLEESVHFWVSCVLFVIIRAYLGKRVGSIGYLFLGIEKESKSVRSSIFERENWLTILLGVLFILEGTKQLVRWTQMFVPEPIFGFFPDDATQVLIHIAFGVSSIIAGYWFLRLDIKGLYLGIATALIHAFSDALSWELWDPVVEKMVIARRDIQGIPVRDGEVAFMQSLFPEGQLLAAVLAIIAMLFTVNRFKNASEKRTRFPFFS